MKGIGLWLTTTVDKNLHGAGAVPRFTFHILNELEVIEGGSTLSPPYPPVASEHRMVVNQTRVATSQY